ATVPSLDPERLGRGRTFNAAGDRARGWYASPHATRSDLSQVDAAPNSAAASVGAGISLGRHGARRARLLAHDLEGRRLSTALTRVAGDTRKSDGSRVDSPHSRPLHLDAVGTTAVIALADQSQLL